MLLLEPQSVLKLIIKIYKKWWKKITQDNNDFYVLEDDQLSLTKIIVLSLIPGILALIFDIIAAPIVQQSGYPLFFTLVLANIIVLLPSELLILIYFGYKKNKRFSIKGIIPYRKSMPNKNLVLWIIILVAYGYVINMVIFPISGMLKKFLTWMPEVVFSAESDVITSTNFQLYSSTVLITVLIATLLINAILIPIIEELYFRGYLLPRTSRFGKITAILNASLWAIYHIWAPWTIIANLIIFTPIAYVVMKKKDVRLSIFAHMIANFLLVITMVPLLI